jgi:hypothetical protein
MLAVVAVHWGLLIILLRGNFFAELDIPLFLMRSVW